MTTDTRPLPVSRFTRVLFVATILASSFLLFLVQPMIARMALPRFGGAPAVWNSAMLVYQALLLGGYAYAHRLGRLKPRRQGQVHVAVLVVAAFWLPIGLVALRPSPRALPTLWVPWLLALSIGPLFFAISAQAPLLQRWFSFSRPAQNPYALYAASNFGSFAGLIAYPLLVEPGLAVRGQRWLWSAGYVLVAVLVAVCAATLPLGAARVAGPAEVVPPSSPPSRGRVVRWVALAFVPSGLMLATSTYITTDIVAMPLLWVLPLGLYLLSFSVAFATDRTAADLQTRIAPVAILLFGGILVGGTGGMPFVGAAMALGLLFLAAVALHSALYRLRPEPDRLTGFYLAMSFGGALGGVFAALIAPLVFDWTWEYPLLILAAGTLAPQEFLLSPVRRLWQGSPRRRRILLYAVGIAVLTLVAAALAFPEPGDAPGPVQQVALLAMIGIGLIAIGSRSGFSIALLGALIAFGGYKSVALSLQPGARTRSYFGVYTVRGSTDATGGLRQLAHGTTVHGTELLGSRARESMPTAYYVPASGVGQAMQAAPTLYGPAARIGVVGLGAGTLACYARPGQDWRIFEIDPTVARIARTQFRFLGDCLPGARIVLGDARLNLAAAAPDSLDLLALDAFSSDAVPMHLLTREAFATYARVLTPRGLLLVHISNRFLDLEPVLAAAATVGGWQAAGLLYRPAAGSAAAASASQWIALSHDPAVIAALRARDAGWMPLKPRAHFTPWSDDYSTILPLLKGIR